jgi:hypothetical protein
MRFNHLRRGELIGVLGGVAVVCPFAAHAQRPAMPVVGTILVEIRVGPADLALMSNRQGAILVASH